ncbi:arsinothricin resistance N-acetyltransferase ArsN1 family B [Marinomonas epiphytica]
MIRSVQLKDAPEIAEIYNYYVTNTCVTFEEQIVTPAIMEARIQSVQDDDFPWLVAELNEKVIGYAYATKWKERSAYRFSVEATVYLSNGYHGKGMGSQLYTVLFEKLKERDIHNIIGGITLPNPASVGLHEKMGMSKVAHFESVGYKFGQWLDVGYWQLHLPSNHS